MNEKIVVWVIKLIPAIIMLQTLFFKFTAAPESVYIFTTMKMEPWGRIGTGIGELIAAILILSTNKRLTLIGAIMAVGIMAGAIVSHLLILGISVMDDGGKLFGLALITTIFALILIFMNRNELINLPFLGKFIR